ncbi:uncharacterized protein LOC116926436 [Daphnia magna]|uniref:Uncharacterized protein n=2 Tax=Daphnia magna TaxID=35525 RepID=A0A0N8AZ81_9CRUS|nr:uncharacterized protein LOC116926436 [Daphnia magna]XP_032789231.1 uncharacterized protein LOC116926436 [Daphnia magna]XP_032789233.1 uncharacterized protein LOC116926436 [Daphnia magna]KAK4025841.1 hypothetical protein OUZ56_014886 [Daphnia magna]KZS12325.1 Uncharacterized protein APZ42_022407 [Daphnia magna]
MKYTQSLGFIMGVVLLASGCFAKPSSRVTVMENEKVMDSDNQFILRWTVLEGTGDIEIEMQVNCTGWLGISFAEGQIGTPGSYSDVIMGGFNDDLQMGYIEDRHIYLENPDPANGHLFDDSNDILLKSATYEEPWTIIRIARSLNTGDSQDIAIVPGPMTVGWTYSSTDDTSLGHDVAGISRVTFIPV